MNNDLFTKAKRAFAFRNYDTTIFWMLRFLSQEPECWEARQLARRAAFKKWDERKSVGGKAFLLGRVLMRSKGLIKIAQASFFFLRKEKAKAGVVIESVLGEFPYDRRAHHMMTKIAQSSHPRFAREALDSFETLLQGSCSKSRKMKLLEEGAAFCLLSQQGKGPWNACKAKEFYKELLKIDPKNLKARKGIKKASAALLILEDGK